MQQTWIIQKILVFFWYDEWQDRKGLSVGITETFSTSIVPLWFQQHLWSEFKFLRNVFNLNNSHKIRVSMYGAHTTRRIRLHEDYYYYYY